MMFLEPAAAAGGGMPSGSALIGGSSHAAFYKEIVSRAVHDVGEALNGLRRSFNERIVMPSLEASRKTDFKVNKIKDEEAFDTTIRPLVTLDDFKFIPKIMQPVVMAHPDVITGIRRGTMTGFGIDPDDILPTDQNPYHRLATTGRVNTWESDIPVKEFNGVDRYVMEFEYDSTDPEVTADERFAIQDTFDYVSYILEHTNLDPTDIDLERG